jgi:uncharacterized membrane protein
VAGIGFEIRKLLKGDDLIGVLQGYTHSAMTATGPWLLTIFMLTGVVFLGGRHLPIEDLAEFRLIIVYNFGFSLVLAGPVVMVATRYLADAIYMKKVDDAPSMMVTYLALLMGLGAVVVVPFYLFYLDLDRPLAILSIINFLTVGAIWLISAFLSALKDYTAITRAFVAGTALSLASAAVLSSTASTTLMMAGFTAGQALILFALVARVLVEYPYPVVQPFRHARYFRTYWTLALSGLIYNVGIWVDKWIMWTAPQHETLRSGMVSYQDYDSAMFLAYLTIVPSLAAFVMTVETEFYEYYLAYFKSIQNHSSFEHISRAHGDIVRSTLGGARTFIVLQGSICLVMILVSPKIFSVFNINFAQIGMFRIGVLGAFFHVLFLGLSIVLSYFDLRMATLRLQVLFLATNGVFTWLTLKAGFPYYGYGYFLAAIITFAAAFLTAAYYLNRLPYQTFVMSNASVE